MTKTSTDFSKRRKLLIPNHTHSVHWGALLLVIIWCCYSSHGFVIPVQKQVKIKSSVREGAVQVDPITETTTTSTRQLPRKTQKQLDECSSIVDQFLKHTGRRQHEKDFEFRCEVEQEAGDEESAESQSSTYDSVDEPEMSDAGEDEENVDPESDGQKARSQQARKLAIQAALLGSRTGNTKSRSAASSSNASSRSTTSVGVRRIRSASKAKQEPAMQKRLMDALRKSASSNTVNNDKPTEGDEGSSSARGTPKACMTEAVSLAKHSPRKLTSPGIHSTILEIMERQMKHRSAEDSSSAAQGWDEGCFGWEKQVKLPKFPKPGKVLIRRSSRNARGNAKLRFPGCLTVRVATPKEDTEVANLRLSVFSCFSPEVRKQLVSRSVKAVANRRMKGATCIVATVTPSFNARKHNQPPVILGSAECSFHEFDNTVLGERRLPQSILYITEVAVSPKARRRGIGRKILESVNILGEMRGVETLYLHVDVENEAATSMYEKMGYHKVDSSDPMFLEFTTKLNLHDGATKGRRHYLLCKDLVSSPVWLPAPVEQRKENSAQQTIVDRDSPQHATGKLGFEVPRLFSSICT